MYNNSSFFAADIEPDTLSKVVAGISIATGTTSVIGNGLVIIIMRQKCGKNSLFKCLLVHLAICDLLFAILQFADVPTWLNMKWVYGRVLCKIIPPSQLLVSLAAEGTIVVIAIERFKGISNPLNCEWTKKKMILGLSISWLLAGISVLPYLVVIKVIYIYNDPQCVEDWGEETIYDKEKPLIYSLYLFICSFVFPMFILAFLYGKIILILRKPELNNQEFSRLLEKRRKKDIRVTKLLVAVVLAFVVCVLPNHVGHIISLTVDNLTITGAEIVHYVTLIPYPFHCTINPFIYSIVDVKFRNDVKRFLQRKRTMKSTSSRRTASLL